MPGLAFVCSKLFDFLYAVCATRGSDETYQNPSGFESQARSREEPVKSRTRHKANRAPFSFRKEVIQPQVLLRLPCYDFTPIMSHTLSACLLAVGSAISSTAHFRDVTGGVYKARERIHGAVLMRHY